jgi:hypothetical protein
MRTLCHLSTSEALRLHLIGIPLLLNNVCFRKKYPRPVQPSVIEVDDVDR